MALSLAARAARRDAQVHAAVEDALAGGNHHHALNLALRALQSEAAKVRRRRPGHAALIDAELAGSLSAIAAALHDWKPQRPPGCPRVPLPENLLGVYEASRNRTEEGAAQ